MEEKNHMEEKNRQPGPEDAGQPGMSPEKGTRKFPTPGDVFAMLGIALGAQILVSIVGAVVLLIAGSGVEGYAQDMAIRGRMMAVLYAVTMTLALLGILYYRRQRGGEGPVANFSFNGLNPVLLVWAFVLMLVVGIVIEPLVSLLPDPPYESMGQGFWTVVSLVILAPLFEEVICRGVVLGALRAKYGVVTALFFSSLFFGVLHIYPAQVVGAFVLGLVLGYIYLVTRSLWAAIILHAANNGVAYLLLVSGYGDKDLSEIVASRTLYVLIYIAALAVTAVSAMMIRRSLQRMKNPAEA